MSEKFIISGSASNVKKTINDLLAFRKIIGDRDIGDFVGYPVTEYVRASPHTIRLTVFYSTKREYPFKGKGVRSATYNIPDLKRSDADWTKIKSAMGGDNGYMWGRFRATANLNNGRQAVVYGGSEKEAEDRLRALLTLSTAKILTLSISEEKKEGLRATDKILYKPTVRMFPTYFTILNSAKIINESNKELNLPFGTKNDNLSGTFRRTKTTKLPVWMDKEPKNIKPFIAELLRDRGSTPTNNR
ncbi:MAG: hypothetical protein HC907_05065 [Richelia sp. SM1_7_0]|nr:hypothetical protein [Richelia sp. SM1_7_0]